MEYSHNDNELVKQPIGYWSWAAHQAVVTNIRAGLAQFDVTQPQWWVLNQVAAGENGRTREEVTAVLQGYLDVGAALAGEIDALLDRDVLTLDNEDRLRLTSGGDAVYRRCAERQQAMREQAHDGITDEEYLMTLKVLQRMIRNVGGEAWHH
ncbi:MarR family winged helix-turn-helix transcriptional regulator [Streptomyces sp. NBC_01477]|uniref:MarR family winged helix-turn-helix transcriptional regulator n=1 Tax=Streptomyces sp. NBC_01477 TaxID=2976015 RepID=UPI002E378BD5|nr:MarR family winged helix-turn-helix transcriptional regulator [Streptomyces sp. NBC_01477]